MLTTLSGRKASQNEQELTGFVNLLRERGVKRYLEIGARHGDTFYHVMRELPRGSYGVAVDLPGALWGIVTSRNALTHAVKQLKTTGYNALALFGDSQSSALCQQLHSLGPFDAVLIDGDHTLPGVTRDWENYQGIAPLVAFHDIVGTGQSEKVKHNPVEVPILWEKIKATTGLVTHEFIAPGSAMGIGVVETK